MWMFTSSENLNFSYINCCSDHYNSAVEILLLCPAFDHALFFVVTSFLHKPIRDEASHIHPHHCPTYNILCKAGKVPATPHINLPSSSSHWLCLAVFCFCLAAEVFNPVLQFNTVFFFSIDIHRHFVKWSGLNTYWDNSFFILKILILTALVLCSTLEGKSTRKAQFV